MVGSVVVVLQGTHTQHRQAMSLSETQAQAAAGQVEAGHLPQLAQGASERLSSRLETVATLPQTLALVAEQVARMHSEATLRLVNTAAQS